jgi:DNA mismatch endonuclease (patch repair protein)
MADKFTPDERSRIMSRVKGKNTQPEKIVRTLLHSLGYRFRLHRKDLPGNPDIVLPRHKRVIFVHGCFWHGHEGCPRAARPTTNVDFWNRKIDGNIKRDKKVRKELRSLDWEILIIWQCQTRSTDALRMRIEKFLKP